MVLHRKARWQPPLSRGSHRSEREGQRRGGRGGVRVRRGSVGSVDGRGAHDWRLPLVGVDGGQGGKLLEDLTDLVVLQMAVVLVELQQLLLDLLDVVAVLRLEAQPPQPRVHVRVVVHPRHHHRGDGDHVRRVVEAEVQPVRVVDEMPRSLDGMRQLRVRHVLLHRPVRVEDHEVEVELLHKEVLAVHDVVDAVWGLGDLANGRDDVLRLHRRLLNLACQVDGSGCDEVRVEVSVRVEVVESCQINSGRCYYALSAAHLGVLS
mmetsp:Transcript_26995/g.64082  ORF Transcript_26995/g.64082 Transcript_26995/m.64082 type:complete len:263 (+) Transcript_26995:136-924(+)|eukprot:CAMPEP_0177737076 /NCGR_PEP_ID=MMETSP0484_2-20121128/25690_1 /TAXON_ID=354590 /ORGANISM="Rhodomonas lens, Strain RHODO" /LENGTH=262 /DNA_ID=CAMNT_0019250829 /DNA_START=32 /DNA_END=820 /DNA_ORIENTATION=-